MCLRVTDEACGSGDVFVQELAKQIDDYTATYGPDDQLEWSLVLGEIRAFIEVLCRHVSLLHHTNNLISVTEMSRGVLSGTLNLTKL